MYGISEQESCCGSDCVTSHFCEACDLVQVSRQLRLQAPDVKKKLNMRAKKSRRHGLCVINEIKAFHANIFAR
jgi:hypothetical protein